MSDLGKIINLAKSPEFKSKQLSWILGVEKGLITFDEWFFIAFDPITSKWNKDFDIDFEINKTCFIFLEEQHNNQGEFSYVSIMLDSPFYSEDIDYDDIFRSIDNVDQDGYKEEILERYLELFVKNLKSIKAFVKKEIYETS